jgi:enoyl-CoA hydratase/carnithine racemase
MSSSAHGSTVLTELHPDGVLVVTLNRPDQRNLWNAELETDYFNALEAAEKDLDVRVIVVTGAGKTFCPGLDPNVLSDVSGGSAYLPDRRPQTFTTTIQKPVIAAINGACAGIGLVQALYCDYRIAARGAKMTTAFSRRGLPAEDGTAWIFSRLVGPSRAFDLMVSGRVFLTDEAYELGLVDQLTEPEDLLQTTLEYAHVIATEVSPVGAALIKQQIWHDLGTTLEQARLLSRHLLAVSKLQPDMAEGARALQERRSPQFPGFGGLPT